MSGEPSRALTAITADSAGAMSSRNGPRPGTLVWFARHEIRLAWRDAIRPGNGLVMAFGAIVVLAIMHAIGFALAMIVPSPAVMARPGNQALLMLILSFGVLSVLAMMIAQSLEAVTRVFYVRGDLELVLSSPAAIARVFVVRMATILVTSMSVIGMLVLPFINMLGAFNDWRWFTAYGVLLALGALAEAMALLITVGLFHLIGPRRTRLVTQIVGAVIGAATVIGTQVPIILRAGTLSRLAYLSDRRFLAALPGPSSWIWLPAHAAHGDFAALALLLTVAVGALITTIVVFSGDFAAMVVASGGIATLAAPTQRIKRFASRLTPARLLRLKELRLILRDPWLISQSLLQILYLAPPALMLWRNFSGAAGELTVLVPVIVMAAGQLGGGLAWLALSAEDAPELIATAPISTGLAFRAKIEAVIIAVGAIVAPFLIAVAVVEPALAAIGVGFSALSVGSNTFVQFAFRTQARRNQFRRRQRSSVFATFTETLLSISWAGAAGLVAAHSLLAVLPIGLAVLLIALVSAISPRRT